jgi:hypothetical protein
MTWVDRIMGPRRAPRSRVAKTPIDLTAALGWFDCMSCEELGALRHSADIARHLQPKNASAHAAFAAASIAAVRAGYTDDLDEDVSAARSAAMLALGLAPKEPLIMALSAPALAGDDPSRAEALMTAARRKLGKKLPASLIKAAEEGARRPFMGGRGA